MARQAPVLAVAVADRVSAPSALRAEVLAWAAHPQGVAAVPACREADPELKRALYFRNRGLLSSIAIALDHQALDWVHQWEAPQAPNQESRPGREGAVSAQEKAAGPAEVVASVVSA